MDRQVIKILLDEGASPPERKTAGSAGADLHAFLDSPLRLAPMQRHAVGTGVRIELPPGFEAQVRPRSGLALEKGITCLNTPGTIDSDYRGEIRVILINLGREEVTINPGDRIAQLVVSRYTYAEFEESGVISDSERGAGGFGSTGD